MVNLGMDILREMKKKSEYVEGERKKLMQKNGE